MWARMALSEKLKAPTVTAGLVSGASSSAPQAAPSRVTSANRARPADLGRRNVVTGYSFGERWTMGGSHSGPHRAGGSRRAHSDGSPRPERSPPLQRGSPPEGRP